MKLSGKKLLLGICGSIAAYKSALLVRLLIKEGAEVKVIMTESAKSFISPLTLGTLSKNPVHSSLANEDEGTWTNHVELGLWADLFIIAPASANTLSKMAAGICDNLLLTTYLSAKCPVWFAPAMDLDMWKHPATQSNIDQLSFYGNKMIPVGKGELASGLSGDGRLAEPEDIFSLIFGYFHSGSNSPLNGKKVLITAGPTREKIDPVRFISNHSTGTMGFALAEKLAAEGCEVHLVHGPVNLKATDPSIKLHPVESAAEMYEACASEFPDSHIFIAAAAVADFSPTQASDKKIKKEATDPDLSLELKLQKTKDILKEMSKLKKPGQLLVGFALETDNEEENARRKLKSKGLDMIVLNSLSDEGAGFGLHSNRVSIIDKHNNLLNFGLKSKAAVATDIINHIITLIDDADPDHSTAD